MKFQWSDYPQAFLEPVHFTRGSAWLYHVPMAAVLMKLLTPRTFVELGTHGGDSYMAFCAGAAGLATPTACTAIDTWQGDSHTGNYGPEILRQLQGRHDPKYAAFSRLLRTSFDEAALGFPNGSIDLLHIDGLHTYEAVRHDFETWLPKVSKRGVVLFHDTAVRDGDFGVWKLWREVSADRPHFEVPYGYGLGMLAVGEEVPQTFLEFLNEIRASADLLMQFFSLGQRCELLRNSWVFAESVCQTLLATNAWRRQTGQPCQVEHPSMDYIWQFPNEPTLAVVNGAQQTVGDAQRLLQELGALRGRTG